MALETAPKGITVNVIAPGFVHTDMVAAVPQGALATVMTKIPVGRLGSSHETRAVQFLVD